jgi:cytochrome c oxidase subunit 2
LTRLRQILLAGLGPAMLSGCAGVQSALLPRGQEALDIDPLLWTATGVSAAVTGVVTLLVAAALWGPPRWRAMLANDAIVWGGGIVLPVIVLSALLVYGLFVLQAGATRTTGAGEPGITVVGKRWWWEIRYHDVNGRDVVSANELRLPVGRSIAVRLLSDDVIHSFWAPQLAGKLDMIPGRENVLTLEATEPGTSRGQCAEYCGGAHALMSFYVVAMPQADYDDWLRREASPASAPRTGEQRRGLALFLDNGCGACHAIRGTEARGVIGPDLTHVGSRLSLAAAALPNDAAAFARWIHDNQHVKPENLMPPYRYFGEDELAAIGAYLDSLE